MLWWIKRVILSLRENYPLFASVSAAKVIEQLIKAVMLLKDEAAKQNWTVLGIGLGTPGIVDETNRIVLGGAENIIGWENIDVASLFGRTDETTGSRWK